MILILQISIKGRQMVATVIYIPQQYIVQVHRLDFCKNLHKSHERRFCSLACQVNHRLQEAGDKVQIVPGQATPAIHGSIYLHSYIAKDFREGPANGT